MIERTFIAQKTREYFIRKFVEEKLGNVGISSISLKKIPLGEKIIINTSRPGLIVGSKGANIRDLTKALKKEFKLENPQLEINEVKDIFLDANIVAERIASSLERFGSARFKGIGHKILENVMSSGALGVEVIVSGKIPGARAKSWRFYQGYLKKCGDIAVTGVQKAKTAALLKTGIIGIQVSIMPPDIVLPDYVNIRKELVQESSVKDVKESALVSEVAGEEAAGEKAGDAKSKKKASGEKEKTEKKKAASRKKADAKENKDVKDAKEVTADAENKEEKEEVK